MLRNFEDSKIEKIDIKETREHGYNIIVPPSKGFNYPYVLFIPFSINNKTTLVVEGANSEETSNTINEGMEEVIKESMFRCITKWNYKTDYPILTPVFPRFYDYDLNKGIYTHMLTSDALNYNKNGLKRIDLQLINMIYDAKKRLKNNDIIVDEKIIIDGFSASSKFANRFALLHPEIIKQVIAGAVSGTLILPIKKIGDEILLYPIGCGNTSIVDDKKIELFKQIPQFYYMGDSDINDPFISCDSGQPKYSSAINAREASQLYKYIGERMMPTRWENIQKIYKELGVNATFKAYKKLFT